MEKLGEVSPDVLKAYAEGVIAFSEDNGNPYSFNDGKNDLYTAWKDGHEMGKKLYNQN